MLVYVLPSFLFYLWYIQSIVNQKWDLYSLYFLFSTVCLKTCIGRSLQKGSKCCCIKKQIEPFPTHTSCGIGLRVCWRIKDDNAECFSYGREEQVNLLLKRKEDVSGKPVVDKHRTRSKRNKLWKYLQFACVSY